MGSGRVPVAVLGATGSVGQRFIQLLHRHPWFEVAELVASDRSTGKAYGEATDWRLDATMPPDVRDMRVKDYSEDLTSPVAFSALPGEVAGRSNSASPRPVMRCSPTVRPTAWSRMCR